MTLGDDYNPKELLNLWKDLKQKRPGEEEHEFNICQVAPACPKENKRGR